MSKLSSDEVPVTVSATIPTSRITSQKTQAVQHIINAVSAKTPEMGRIVLKQGEIKKYLAAMDSSHMTNLLTGLGFILPNDGGRPVIQVNKIIGESKGALSGAPNTYVPTMLAAAMTKGGSALNAPMLDALAAIVSRPLQGAGIRVIGN
ncbi:MAG TPA: hypothetical protein PK765_06485 [bacterium]|nr:hypothetical protein [bacterium]